MTAQHRIRAKRQVVPFSSEELDPRRTPFMSARRLSEGGFGDHETIRKAIEAGTIPSVRYERTDKVPTRWVRKALGLDADGEPVGS